MVRLSLKLACSPVFQPVKFGTAPADGFGAAAGYEFCIQRNSVYQVGLGAFRGPKIPAGTYAALTMWADLVGCFRKTMTKVAPKRFNRRVIVARMRRSSKNAAGAKKRLYGRG